MKKVKSGLTLIGVGIVLNLLGRVIITITKGGDSVSMAGLMAAWMLASVVFVLFGLFRVIVGLAAKNQPEVAGSPDARPMRSDEPPIPKP